MSLRAHSNHELLKILLGSRTAEKLCTSELGPLLFAEEGSIRYVRKLAAAREFVKRALEEELHQQGPLSSPGHVSDYLRVLLSGREYEVFVCLFLTTRHHLIVAEELFRGTLADAPVYPREVVKRALAVNAAAVIFAHNHPSGVAEPSPADIAITQCLKQALNLVDVRVLDHIIVTGGCAVSMAEKGMM